MSLCAIIGQGQVGQYVADHLRRVVPNAQVIGLRAAKPWLKSLFPEACFISSIQFGKCISELQRIGAKEVIFAGEAYRSFFAATPDTMTIRYLRRQMNLYLPYSYLRAIQQVLSDHDITLRSILDIFPELSAEVGFEAGMRNGYQGNADLAAAANHTEHQRSRKISRAFIVDAGKVLMFQTGLRRTDDLIRKFGASSARKNAAFPVLCKLSLKPCEKIDVPTIGEETVKLCIANGIRGIVLEGGRNILMQRDAVIRLANEGSIYICAR